MAKKGRKPSEISKMSERQLATALKKAGFFKGYSVNTIVKNYAISTLRNLYRAYKKGKIKPEQHKPNIRIASRRPSGGRRPSGQSSEKEPCVDFEIERRNKSVIKIPYKANIDTKNKQIVLTNTLTGAKGRKEDFKNVSEMKAWLKEKSKRGEVYKDKNGILILMNVNISDRVQAKEILKGFKKKQKEYMKQCSITGKETRMGIPKAKRTYPLMSLSSWFCRKKTLEWLNEYVKDC